MKNINLVKRLHNRRVKVNPWLYSFNPIEFKEYWSSLTDIRDIILIDYNDKKLPSYSFITEDGRNKN